MQVFLALAGLGAMFMGHSIWGLIAFLGWFALDSARRGPAQYALVDPRAPHGPHEAALLAMVPDRALRRLDDMTYAVYADEGTSPVVEIWHAISGPGLSEIWFDLEMGEAPRVSGHADRVGALLDAELLDPAVKDRISLRSGWLCWTTDCQDRSLPQLLDRVNELGRRVTECDVRGPRAREALRQGSPLLHALIMLSAPAYFELWPRARSVRPSWRWLARESGVCREARARAVRLLARSGDPAEVLDLLDKVSSPGVETPQSDAHSSYALQSGGAPEADNSRPQRRAAVFLSDPCRHVQVAALTLLEHIGTPAQQGAIVACAAARRKHRTEVSNAGLRTLAAIEGRHGAVQVGALALVNRDSLGGSLAMAEDDAEETGPESV